jgi:hypothetical protein
MKNHEELPCALFTEGSEPSLVTTREALFNTWWVPFKRPYKSADPETAAFRGRVSETVARLRNLRDQGRWGFRLFSWDEMMSALKSSKKFGAFGCDFVTVQMLLNSGTPFLLLLLDFLNLCLVWESIPAQFLEDIVVPHYKRLSRYRAPNYRPISLMAVAAKLLQKMVYNRIETWRMASPIDVLVTDFQFGSIKGRERLMLVWLIDAISLNELITS